jgi:hypothetical protein
VSAKILPFKTKAELAHDAEVQAANDMVSEIRKMFTDEQVNEIKIDLENEVEGE